MRLSNQFYMSRNHGKFRKRFNMHKSKYCVNISPVAISDYMSGKMENIASISTSCEKNLICLARMKDDDSICAKCFADATVRRYSELGKNLAANFDLLTNEVLPVEMLPIFKPEVSIVRIESFGDVANITQAITYINIIKANPHVTFAWWSKNAWLINDAIDLVGKPSNVILVESSEKLNVQKDRSANFDKVFTVYDPEHIASEGVKINCGARSCATCRRCYSKRTGSVVNEKLKGGRAA